MKFPEGLIILKKIRGLLPRLALIDGPKSTSKDKFSENWW
jgi:hypothetical protein